MAINPHFYPEPYECQFCGKHNAQMFNLIEHHRKITLELQREVETLKSLFKEIFEGKSSEENKE